MKLPINATFRANPPGNPLLRLYLHGKTYPIFATS